MSRRLAAAALLAACLLPAQAGAQAGANCVTDIRGNQVCGTRPGQCMLDRYRNAKCAQGNGSILADRYGEIVCGAGACVTDINGNIRCAASPGGAVSTGPAGQLNCDGGCVAAAASACRSGPAN